MLQQFRAAQDKAEAIAFTPNAFPANKILNDEATPRVQKIFAELTKMMDEERTTEATPERKQLLRYMAEARANTAGGAGPTAHVRLDGRSEGQGKLFPTLG